MVHTFPCAPGRSFKLETVCWKVMESPSSIPSPVSAATDADLDSDPVEDEHVSADEQMSDENEATTPGPCRTATGQSHPDIGSMVQLPPELDRFCRMPLQHGVDGVSPSSCGSVSVASGSADAATDADEDNEERLASALAQVEELDKLLARQAECERYARFHRLLHAHENDLSLSEKELGDLERLRAHVSMSDPEFTETIFKTQEAIVNIKLPTKKLGETGNAEDTGLASSRITSQLMTDRPKAGSTSMGSGDMTDFIQRNIEMITAASGAMQLTEAEQERLEELLAEESDEDGEDTRQEDAAVMSAMSTSRSHVSMDAADTSSSELHLSSELVVPSTEAELNRLLTRPDPGNPYKFTDAQQQRLLAIDSHLQHLSGNALPPISPSSASSIVSSVTDNQSMSQRHKNIVVAELAAAGRQEEDDLDEHACAQRLTPLQLELLLEQCRREQALQSSQTLSEARHSMAERGLQLVEAGDSDLELS
ncbi:uncharacterized protein LOC135808814 isoform X1 [Sycon ciliatum]|uniref:uncharacterized protein LOC135808814 isoform X1 n=1 Tax=Sycon ciliatum TaxID=27933 RepID=UPI0031F64CA2